MNDVSRKKYKGDPVFTRGGSWFFWDEAYSCEHGPYDTEEKCDSALRAYGETL